MYPEIRDLYMEKVEQINENELGKIVHFTESCLRKTREKSMTPGARNSRTEPTGSISGEMSSALPNSRSIYLALLASRSRAHVYGVDYN